MSYGDGLAPPKRHWVMLCVLLGIALSNLGSAIVNIALPDISRSFASSQAATVWVVNAYQVAGMVCLLPIAVLGESLGLKRVYAGGLAIFTLASLACALSPTLTGLICARLFQGVGGACVSVAGMALVRVIYPHRIISKGFALVALAVAIPGALGPTVAATILAVAKWPWLFLVNVPIGVVGVLLFLAIAPPDVRIARSFDLTGAVLNALAFGFFIVGVGALGVGNPAVAVGEMVAGLIFFGLLVRQQIRHTAPMLPLDLLSIPVFALSVGASLCSYTAQILAYVSLPFMFETTLHLTPVSTGLLVTPWPLMTALSAPIAGHLTSRYRASAITSVGLVILAVGLLLMVFLPGAPANWDIVWRLALCGVGFGLFQTPNNTVMMTAGPVERNGSASGMNALARYLGWALGSALVALIFGLAGDRATVMCLEAGAGFAMLGALASIARRNKPR
jgi:MFS transporter, DHA2 family, multidrug resistance protein